MEIELIRSNRYKRVEDESEVGDILIPKKDGYSEGYGRVIAVFKTINRITVSWYSIKTGTSLFRTTYNLSIQKARINYTLYRDTF